MENINKTKEFLELYRKFEVVLGGYGQTVLNYEDTLSQDEKDKVRICRQMRNYISHHHDGEEFLICSEAMCKFFRMLIQRESDRTHNRVYTLTPIDVNDRLSDIKTTFYKNNRNWMPVVDDGGKCLGSMELFQFLHLLARQNPNKKLSSVIDAVAFSNSIPMLYDGSAELDNFEGNDAVIIDDNGRYVGILKN